MKGLYLPGFGPEDAGLDIGDSTITETTGIGGFAMAAAPAIVLFVGGEVSDAIDNTLAMYEITLAEHPSYKVPILGFRGTPTGIDTTLVVRSGVLPAINTGIAGREPRRRPGRGRSRRAPHVRVRCGHPGTRPEGRGARSARGKGASMNEIFKYRAPTSRAELYGLLADHGDGARVLAGGTDLLVDIRNGLCRPEMVVNLKKVEDFEGLWWSETDGLIIGPAVTVNEILDDEKVRESFPLLAECGRDARFPPAEESGNGCGQHCPRLSRRRHGARPALPRRPRPNRFPAGEAGRYLWRSCSPALKRTALRPDEIIESINVPPQSAGRVGLIPKAEADRGPRPRPGRSSPHEPRGSPAARHRLGRTHAGAGSKASLPMTRRKRGYRRP